MQVNHCSRAFFFVVGLTGISLAAHATLTGSDFSEVAAQRPAHARLRARQKGPRVQ
jgi:hypothetical protein